MTPLPRKNYTEREKRTLLTLVKKYTSVIDNKSTSAAWVEKKKQAWQIVALEFNASSVVPRTAKQLNTAYQNFKRTSRHNVAEENNENRIATGGTFTPALSEIDAQVFPEDQLTPLSNDCDSASNYNSEHTAYESVCSMVIDHQLLQPLIKVEVEDHPQSPLDQPASSEDHLKANDEDRSVSPVDQPTSPVDLPASPVNKPKLPRSTLQKQKKIFKNLTTEQIKQKFYIKKLESAQVEKLNKIAKYKLTRKNLKIADMELKIKKIQYSSLLSIRAQRLLL